MTTIHPATQRRLNVQAEHGRKLSAYGEACQMLAAGDVTISYVERKREEVIGAAARLVEAAHDEADEVELDEPDEPDYLIHPDEEILYRDGE